MGNVARTGTSACCSSTSCSPKRLRVNGTARIEPAEFVDAALPRSAIRRRRRHSRGVSELPALHSQIHARRAFEVRAARRHDRRRFPAGNRWTGRATCCLIMTLQGGASHESSGTRTGFGPWVLGAGSTVRRRRHRSLFAARRQPGARSRRRRTAAPRVDTSAPHAAPPSSTPRLRRKRTAAAAARRKRSRRARRIDRALRSKTP